MVPGVAHDGFGIHGLVEHLADEPVGQMVPPGMDAGHPFQQAGAQAVAHGGLRAVVAAQGLDRMQAIGPALGAVVDDTAAKAGGVALPGQLPTLGIGDDRRHAGGFGEGILDALDVV